MNNQQNKVHEGNEHCGQRTSMKKLQQNVFHMGQPLYKNNDKYMRIKQAKYQKLFRMRNKKSKENIQDYALFQIKKPKIGYYQMKGCNANKQLMSPTQSTTTNAHIEKDRPYSKSQWITVPSQQPQPSPFLHYLLKKYSQNKHTLLRTPTDPQSPQPPQHPVLQKLPTIKASQPYIYPSSIEQQQQQQYNQQQKQQNHRKHHGSVCLYKKISGYGYGQGRERGKKMRNQGVFSYGSSYSYSNVSDRDRKMLYTDARVLCSSINNILAVPKPQMHGQYRYTKQNPSTTNPINININNNSIQTAGMRIISINRWKNKNKVTNANANKYKYKQRSGNKKYFSCELLQQDTSQL